MNIVRFTLFILLLLHSGVMIGQKVLALDKPGKVKRLHYYEGDIIRVKLQDDKIIKGKIILLKDSTFIIGENEVKLTRIKSVIKKRSFFDFSGKLFKVAGVFFVSIVGVNSLIDDQTEFNESTVTVSSGLLGTGFALSAFKNRRYRLDRNCALKILDITMVAPSENHE